MSQDEPFEKKPDGEPAAAGESQKRSGRPAGNRPRRQQRGHGNQRGPNPPREQAAKAAASETAANSGQAGNAQRGSRDNNRQQRDQRRRSNPRGGNPVQADQPNRPEQPSGERNLRPFTARRTEGRRQGETRPAETGQRTTGEQRPRREGSSGNSTTQGKTWPRRPNQGSGARRGQGGRPNPADNGQTRAPSVPRRVRGGIKARSEEGEFGKNWWAKRWLLAMERLMDGARLQRGRKYARMGQVLSMSEANGGIVARVQGSRAAPYKVNIRVASLTDEQWSMVYDVLADQAIFAAQLLAGEMPPNIEEAFSTAEVSLFPTRGGDLMTECSCPDWVNPCKHIAAAHYILGDRFDEDPFLLLRMRGRSQDEILQALRLRRTGLEEAPRVMEHVDYEVEEEAEPLDEALDDFWQIGVELENFEVNIQSPAIALPILKRLGDPDFASKYSLEQLLGPAYESMSQTALFLAFTDISRGDAENGGNGDTA